MASKYETSIFTQKQLDNARVRGQVKGWVQGAVSTFLFLLLFEFLGWIPAVIILGLIGFMGYKIFSAGKKAGS